jgi:hypothetical protein
MSITVRNASGVSVEASRRGNLCTRSGLDGLSAHDNALTSIEPKPQSEGQRAERGLEVSAE